MKTKNFKKRSRPVSSGRRRGHGSRGERRAPGKLDVQTLIQKEVEGTETKVYEAKNSFSDFPLSSQLLRRIEKKGYVNPTEIQDKTILEIIKGKDIIGLAGTGTGKTAAFVIPIIQQLIEDPLHNRAFIIAPTRELASQISEEFRSLTKDLRLWSTTLIGGTSVHKSIASLKRTNHVVIGTPGRLIDMAKRRHLDLSTFGTLVLDEFDQMLDMGFLEDIQYLERGLTNKSQTLLFSATLDKSQRKIVEEITVDPVHIKAGVGTHLTKQIKQELHKVSKGSKRSDVVQDLIQLNADKKVLLFCETKRQVDDVHKTLKGSNLRVDHIHGDKSQRSREFALRKFKNGKIDILVATDVMARGIDVNDIGLVINYQVPRTYDSYIHRIGRTGRAGKMGRAITLV